MKGSASSFQGRTSAEGSVRREVARRSDARWRPGFTASVGLVLLFCVAGACALATGDASAPVGVVDDAPSTSTASGWPRNESGQTYGSIAGVVVQPPDLVAVVGTDATGREREGYVYADELDIPSPSSPAAAADQARGVAPLVLPLYARDGSTVLGSWRLG